MSVISITLLPGYSAETEQRLVQRVALATRSVIAVPAAGTTVFVNHASAYQRDGRVFNAGGPVRPNAVNCVREFLALTQRRDLTAAARFLAPGFVMRFPDSQPMHRLEQLIDWSRGRYQHVSKTFERFDECWGDEASVVFCSGTLSGVWLDGSPFEGVRFIDRFEVAEGLIRRQDVWNDLAEARTPLA